MDDSSITCDEIIKSYDEDAETDLYDKANLNENKATSKLTCIFINYCSIIDSC